MSIKNNNKMLILHEKWQNLSITCHCVVSGALYTKTMDIRVLFGRNLKIFRKKRRLSQEQLSEIVDISPMHLSKIERGLTFVSADLLEKLSESLEIPVARLFCQEFEQIYGGDVLKKIDRITEKHLIRAMEGIKGEIRQDDEEN